MTNLTFVPRDPHDVDLAKKFTRACLKVGLLREIRPRRYVKPSMKRRLKSRVARAKLAKTARRHAAGEVARLQRLGMKE
jgi:ribosomal protein S21